MNDSFIGSTLSKEQWSQLDRRSRDIFVRYLKTCTTATEIEESQDCISWDVKAIINGRKVLFEIKDRNITSLQFGDVMVQADKNDNCKKYCPGWNVVAVNFYTDGIFAMSPITPKFMKKIKLYWPETSYVTGASHKYRYKECLSLPQYHKIKIENNTFKKI